MTPFREFLHGRGAGGVTFLQALALLPPVAVALGERDPAAFAGFAAALGVALVWDVVFASVRRRPVLPAGVTTAAIFAVMAPPEMSLWQIAVVLSLGTVIGELVFGGRGFAFLGAATVALALTVLSFRDLQFVPQSQAVALATLPGAALLLVSGLLPWRVPVAFVAVLLLLGGPDTPQQALAIIGASLFALTFLVADPTAAAVTGNGRLAHGALAAFLVWVFGGSAGINIQPEAFVFAALMASIFAPLLDHGAVVLNTWRRKRRHV